VCFRPSIRLNTLPAVQGRRTSRPRSSPPTERGNQRADGVQHSGALCAQPAPRNVVEPVVRAGLGDHRGTGRRQRAGISASRAHETPQEPTRTSTKSTCTFANSSFASFFRTGALRHARRPGRPSGAGRRGARAERAIFTAPANSTRRLPRRPGRRAAKPPICRGIGKSGAPARLGGVASRVRHAGRHRRPTGTRRMDFISVTRSQDLRVRDYYFNLAARWRP
jgi:hypothetical protein